MVALRVVELSGLDRGCKRLAPLSHSWPGCPHPSSPADPHMRSPALIAGNHIARQRTMKICLYIWHNDIVQYPDVTLDVVAIPQNTSELKDMHFVCSSHKCSWSAKSTTLSSVRLWHSGVSDKALTSEMWPVWQLLPPQRKISKDISIIIL